MKSLIILRGIPGSGKSTVAEVLADTLIAVEFGGENFKYPIFTADDYFMKDGEYKFDFNKLGAAHKECQNGVAVQMELGTEKIFVANTNTTDKEMAPYFKMAEKFDYKVFTLIVENRHGNSNVHNVPADKVEIMKNRFSIKL